MDQLKRVRVVATGYVQGVFFRTSLRKEAQRLNLTGWVRNREDGAVEAELQGPALAIDEAVAICRQGPGHAEVESLVIDEIAYLADEDGFQIR